jgi:signal transduction histidine kinase
MAKAREAKRHGIKFYPDVDLDEDCIVPSIDIIRAFANILDNAVEGCLEVENASERIIIFSSAVKSGLFLVSCKNSMNRAKLKKVNGRYFSTKSSSYDRGLGLAIIEDLARESNGGLTVASDGSYFQIRLSIVADSREVHESTDIARIIERLSTAADAPEYFNVDAGSEDVASDVLEIQK